MDEAAFQPPPKALEAIMAHTRDFRAGAGRKSAPCFAVAKSHLGTDPRLTIPCEDAVAVIRREAPNSLDLIFADGGAGKHTLLDEALALLRPGGIYICDDTKPHPMWPPEHAVKIPPLMEALAARQDFRRIYIDWSSGVVVMVKLTR